MKNTNLRPVLIAIIIAGILISITIPRQVNEPIISDKLEIQARDNSTQFVKPPKGLETIFEFYGYDQVSIGSEILERNAPQKNSELELKFKSNNTISLVAQRISMNNTLNVIEVINGTSGKIIIEHNPKEVKGYIIFAGVLNKSPASVSVSININSSESIISKYLKWN